MCKDPGNNLRKEEKNNEPEGQGESVLLLSRRISMLKSGTIGNVINIEKKGGKY